MRKFEVVDNKHRKYLNSDIILPTRATYNSAGYDFYCPETTICLPRQITKIFTDIKVKMNDFDVLMLYVRSSIGIKKNIVLANGTGVIDSDFYSNEENDGNIMMALYNYGEKEIIIEKDERVIQGIFMTYGILENDHEKNLLKKYRNGGIGSTSK